ncbi:hypothetical protein A9Q99_01565 [Gammaproteobacteria bacterium 45_16_T64]|nr:hypothetical protein A9Q99_01565 [Gammaproteobacteria bacterium 45_16_T64]
MSNLFEKSIFIILPIMITACGGGGGGGGSDESSAVTPSEPTVVEAEAATKDSLASPDATFNTSKDMRYTAYNTSNYDVTLFVYNDRNTLMSRVHIPSNTQKSMEYEVAMADSSVTHTWRYRELVHSEDTNTSDLASVEFSTF